MIKVLYFAKLKDDIDCVEELIEYQPSLSTIQHLVDILVARSERRKKAFNNPIVCARNQVMASFDAVLEDGDEIAFFPPVTGG